MTSREASDWVDERLDRLLDDIPCSLRLVPVAERIPRIAPGQVGRARMSSIGRMASERGDAT